MKIIYHLAADLKVGEGYVSPGDIYLLTTTSLQLGFIIVVFSLILYKVKMNISAPLLFLNAAFILCFVARFALDLIKVIKTLDNMAGDYDSDKVVIVSKILNYVGGRFSKIAVIYFVFQAKQVQIKMQAKDA